MINFKINKRLTNQLNLDTMKVTTVLPNDAIESHCNIPYMAKGFYYRVVDKRSGTYKMYLATLFRLGLITLLLFFVTSLSAQIKRGIPLVICQDGTVRPSGTCPWFIAGTITGHGTVCSGINSTVLTLGGNEAGTIQWQSSLNNVDFSDIPNSTNSTYNAVGLIVSTWYRCVINNSQYNLICPSVKITVSENGGYISENLTAIEYTTTINGAPVELKVITPVEGLTYQWFKLVNGNPVAVTDGAGGQTSIFYPKIGVLGSSTYFLSVSGVCGVENSIQANVVVKPRITPSNRILYVTATGRGNFSGSSWNNALPGLADALRYARENESDWTAAAPLRIWTAGGTYKPEYSPQDGVNFGADQGRNNSFLMVKNVQLYGGFAGTETTLAGRNLSVTTNATILSGDLDGNDGPNFSNNENNAYHVVVSSGEVGTALLNGFTITGGNANNPEPITIYNHVSYGNYGGGMLALNTSSPTLTYVNISGNAANFGGGMYNWTSSPVLTNVNLSGNTAISMGGGMFNNNASPEITHSTISGNNAGNGGNGGGIYNDNSSPSLTNLLVSGNNAGWGGAIYNNNSSSPVLTNLTISGNNAFQIDGGGGIINVNSSPQLRNTIIYGNSDGISEWDNNRPPSVISNSLVQGITGTSDGNIDGSQNPGFVNPVNYASAPTTDGDYHITDNISPVFNKGNNAWFDEGQNPDLHLITTDLDGNPRIKHTKIDMGAYELQPTTYKSDANGIIYVTTTGSGNFSGISWANASNDLQLSINAPGVQQVWVAGGTYMPTQIAGYGADGTDYGYKSFVLKKDVKIYGGFAGNETSLSTRDLSQSANASILSGNLGDPNTDNARQVVISAGNVGTAELNGFTIKDGNARGGGYIFVSSEEIYATKGGGIYSIRSSPILTNLIISDNYAADAGGGIYNGSFSSPELTNVTISGNTAGSKGGGIYNDNIFFLYLSNVTISGNVAPSGGGFYNDSFEAVLLNVTISGNEGTNGGGIYNASSLEIYNSLIYGNSSGILNSSSASTKINHSLVQGFTDETNGNISGDQNPLFVNPLSPGKSTRGDYRLQLASPAINTGNNNHYPNLNVDTKDLAGNPRLFNGVIDMGAFELQTAIITPDANGIIYVTTSGAGNFSGKSWTNASNDLQLSMNATGTLQVWVSKGTYQPTVNTSFAMKNGMAIYGGFSDAGNPEFGDRDWKTYPTILKGNNARVINNNFTSEVPLTSSTLDGFTITDGIVAGQSQAGAGIYNQYASPTLINLIISGNNSAWDGGGMYNSNSSPIITNVTVSGNNATWGGGIYNNSSSFPVLTNVTISGNKATAGGGGIINVNSSPKIRNSIVYGNSDGVNDFDASSISDISFSLIQGRMDESNGNISGISDPLFVSPLAPGLNTGGDYRLKGYASPAFAKGSIVYFASGAVPDLSSITTDLDGNPLISKTGTLDLGAYQYMAGSLPVTIVSFSAEAAGNRAKLFWTTATEINNKEFIISRSADGINFSETGRVAGAGNSNTPKDYVYFDENPSSGINFYRLEQMDYDSRKTNLGVRAVNFTSLVNNLIKVYPNPVKNAVRIEFSANTYHQLELTDVSGKLLKYMPLNTIDVEKRIDMSNLTSGFYFIKLTGKGGVESRKVIKE